MYLYSLRNIPHIAEIYHPRTLIVLLLLCCGLVQAQTTQQHYLSGKGPDDPVSWDFFCTDGMQSGRWTTIPVPSNWELQGFGNYNYGHDRNKHSEQGRYRKTFNVPASWKGKSVILVFEAVMTDTIVKINGKSAGDIHQGGFYEFSYDISSLLEYDSENIIEVDVNKVSADSSVEYAERKADYWVFGGIYRPVYLKVLPSEYISRTAIDASANGRFRIDLYLNKISDCDSVSAQIFDSNGTPVGNIFTDNIAKGQTLCTLQSGISKPKQWTAETPYLYTVQLDLMQNGRVVHTVSEQFGFRTFEVRKDGLFLNDKRIMLKGVNRHCFRPDSGRCLSYQDDLDDVMLVKSMNMNAIRCSHYPPNRSFLNICDQLGLYVLDELAGWQKPPYNTDIGKKLVKELVIRDVNHPSILFWDNGNEGGWNTELDNQFVLYDPQQRAVLHPWENRNGIDTDHYERFSSVMNKLKGPSLFMPTEFLHGLYDGGHGAGLADYWNAISTSPYGAGGFLWVLADEGVVRTDKNGKIDTAGNLAPDGIVGPYHQKEASYYTIRQIWSPVQIAINQNDFNGFVPVQNKYDFTNLSQVSFSWQLADFHSPFSRQSGHTIRQQGTVQGPNLAPGLSGQLNLNLPHNWKTYQALFITAADMQGGIISTWSIPLKTRAEISGINMSKFKLSKFKAVTANDAITVIAGTNQYVFNANNGQLLQVTSSGKLLNLSNGPRLVPATTSESITSVTCSEADDMYIIKAQNSAGLNYFCWKITPQGSLSLEYEYSLSGKYDYYGITFDLPVQSMQSMRWLGQGPCRVWKNRTQGGWLDLWQRNFNMGTPGSVWEYPVFSGCYADMYWLDLKTGDGDFQVINETDGLYFRIGPILNGDNPKNTKLAPIDGDLSFLHAISPIGTKFLKPSDLGPSGQKNIADGSYNGKLIFIFD